MPELAQNFPNPFNGKTTLRYTLPKTSSADIEIFAANGQKVRTIEVQTGLGSQRIAWDGSDDSGRPVATGVYVARLRTDDAVVARKVTLVR